MVLQASRRPSDLFGAGAAAGERSVSSFREQRYLPALAYWINAILS